MAQYKAHAKKLSRYADQWVVLVDRTVVAAGETLREVQEEVERKGIRGYVFHRVPSPISLASGLVL